MGDLTRAFESFDLPADPGLSILIYSAEPGSAVTASALPSNKLGQVELMFYNGGRHGPPNVQVRCAARACGPRLPYARL